MLDVFIHEQFMREAIGLAKQGAGNVHPNPLVGAVLVCNGAIVGKGFHERCGEAHAEVNAIANARQNGFSDFTKATLYVTLEPCCHTGRTPPCTDLIIATGIPIIVCGITDPDDRVSGKGIALLRDAGITVFSEILEDECRELNKIFLKFASTKRPYVLLKSAMSLDGKTATVAGESRWISCEESRTDVHRLRSEYTAVMCGIGTVLADDPMLDVRRVPGRNPVRIVVDSGFHTPIDSHLVKTARAIPLIIAGIDGETGARKERLERAGAVTITCMNRNGRVSLSFLIEKLVSMGIDSILLEGGNALAWSAMQEGIVDRVRWYIAPIVIGGKTAPTPIGGSGVSGISESIRLRNMHAGKIGTDTWIEAEVCSPA